MIKRKVENTFYGERVFYLNEDTGDKYSRISGGIGWPVTDRPGVAAVVSEELVQERSKLSRFWLIDEHEDFNPTTLIRAAAALGRRNHVDYWYCDTSDRGMADFITRSKVSLPTTSPPYLDEPTALNSYIAQVRELLMPGRKRLFFAGSPLASRLLEIPSSGGAKRTARPQDIPLLMALGGCLAAIITWKFDPDEQRLCDVLNQELSIDFDY